MNNRGFTLIEVTAVIIILVGIFIVGFPVLGNMTKKEETKKYDNMVKDLCTAGRTYIYSNLDAFPTLSSVNEEININVSILIEYGNVDKNIVNPKDEETIENDVLKYTVLEDLTLDCEYIEE